jgi:hypothetical protein
MHSPGHGERCDNLITDLHCLDIFAGCHYDARKLVAHDEARCFRHFVATKEVKVSVCVLEIRVFPVYTIGLGDESGWYVRAAKTGGLHFDDDVPFMLD